MQLTYAEKSGQYVLSVPRGSAVTPATLMEDYGFNMSNPRSTSQVAVMYTETPYAAAPFFQYADTLASTRLHSIVSAVEESWRSDGPHVDCPADQELWGFQRANIAYLKRRGGGLVGDEPGLGKTPTAICFANEIRANRVLVICPANIRLQWAQRIREWTQMRWPYTVYPIISGGRGVHPTAEWTIVSYDLARSEGIGRALAKGTYDLLILDEAHMLKTSDSIRTRAVFGDLETGTFRRKHTHELIFPSLASRAGSVLALTGTPLLNRPREAYTLARNLNWDSIDWLSEDAFQSRYNPSRLVTGTRRDGTEYTYNDERSGRHQELQYRMRANFMSRHLKREVLPQLKMPEYDIVRVDETQAVKAALKAESLLHIDPEQFDPSIATLGHISTVRKMMGIAIAPQVADWVDMLIDGGEEKIVLFAWHIEVLNVLQSKLDKHGLLRIDGSVGVADREDRKNRFINDPKYKIILGNMLAMGVGMDGLQQVSNHCLLAEPDWVPGNNVQAIDRLDRGGQRRTVQADIFVAPGSIVEKILASALRKSHTINRTLDKRYQA